MKKPEPIGSRALAVGLLLATLIVAGSLAAQAGAETEGVAPRVADFNALPATAFRDAGLSPVAPEDPIYLAVVKGPAVTDSKYDFQINPPVDWVVKTSASKFLVQINDPKEVAFVFVDCILVEKELAVDDELRAFIKKQHQQVGSYRGLYLPNGRETKIGAGSYKAYVLSGIFQAGQNKVATSVYYVPYHKRLIVIITMCPEVFEAKWAPYLIETVGTLRFTH